MTNFDVPLNELIPKNHGHEAYIVRNDYVRKNIKAIMSYKELKLELQKQWSDFRFAVEYSRDKPTTVPKAIFELIDELKMRREERVIGDDIDTSDLDATYVYPGEEND